MLILWEGAAAFFAVAPWLSHGGDERTCQRRAKPVHLDRWHGRSALLLDAEKSSHHIQNFRSQISIFYGKIILPKLGRISKTISRQLVGNKKRPPTNLCGSQKSYFWPTWTEVQKNNFITSCYHEISQKSRGFLKNFQMVISFFWKIVV